MNNYLETIYFRNEYGEKYLTKVIALLPDSLKWKDKEEKQFRCLIRFSKEYMLLAIGYKSNE